MTKFKSKKTNLQICLHETILNEITEYMKWTDIKYKDHFIEEACKHVLDSNEKWQKHKSLNYDDNMRRKEESATDIQNKMLADDDGMQFSEHKRNLGEELKKK